MTFVLHELLLDISIYIPKVYTILLSSDLKTKKVRHPHLQPHPHPHQNKIKVSALKNEILIKYKRVNQMDPTRKTLRLFASQGDNLYIFNIELDFSD